MTMRSLSGEVTSAAETRREGLKERMARDETPTAMMAP